MCDSFPHGVLFRDEELELRKKLVEMDILDCIIGLGANLFYNSPMEACILICNCSKANSKKNRVLMINAVNEVTRKMQRVCCWQSIYKGL